MDSDWARGDGFGMHELDAQVRDLEDQVTAFAGLGEALKEADGVLGEVSQELAATRSPAPLRTRWTGSREVRAVALA